MVPRGISVENGRASQGALTQYGAARSSAALAELSDWGVLRFSGPERGTFLQGLMTSDVLSLAEGQSGWSCLLTPKGRVRAHVLLFRAAEEILAIGPDQALNHMAEDLGRVIILSRTSLERAAANARPLLLLGPQIPEILSRAASADATIIPDARFEARGAIIVPRADAPNQASRALDAAAGPAGLTRLEAEAFEMLRLEAGIPAFGTELGEGVFPQEARLDSVVGLSKGCYLGQEVMSRLSRRGHVNRLLARLKISGSAPPSAGAKVFVRGADSGIITSAAWSPRESAPLALAYLKREDAETGLPVEIQGPGAALSAEIF